MRVCMCMYVCMYVYIYIYIVWDGPVFPNTVYVQHNRMKNIKDVNLY